MNKIDQIYPLCVVKCPFKGKYSKGLFAAFNLGAAEIPDEIIGREKEVENFWASDFIKKHKIGYGITDIFAYEDLKKIMKEQA